NGRRVSPRDEPVVGALTLPAAPRRTAPSAGPCGSEGLPVGPDIEPTRLDARHPAFGDGVLGLFPGTPASVVLPRLLGWEEEQKSAQRAAATATPPLRRTGGRRTRPGASFARHARLPPPAVIAAVSREAPPARRRPARRPNHRSPP